MKILINLFVIATPMKVLAKYYKIDDADIGENTVIRDFTNLYGCKIGKDCKIAAFVEIGRDVTIGDKCAIEAFVFIPPGVTIENEVFIGPHACFTNDKKPKAVNPWSRISCYKRCTSKYSCCWKPCKTSRKGGILNGFNTTSKPRVYKRNGRSSSKCLEK